MGLSANQIKASLWKPSWVNSILNEVGVNLFSKVFIFQFNFNSSTYSSVDRTRNPHNLCLARSIFLFNRKYWTSSRQIRKILFQENRSRSWRIRSGHVSRELDCIYRKLDKSWILYNKKWLWYFYHGWFWDMCWCSWFERRWSNRWWKRRVSRRLWWSIG